MKKQPIIGITVCSKQDGVIDFSGVDYLYVRRDYAQAVKAAGATPILLNPDVSPQMAAELCDGVVITGGYDIPAEFYGESRHETMRDVETMERVRWELALIDACDQVERPILGICYGAQLMNVHFGGSLYQDISQITDAQSHESGTPSRDHQIDFSRDFLGYAAGDVVAATPRHHQAIKNVAEGWQVAARTADGVIEAMQSGRHFGVQWHPESDQTASYIYGPFVAFCREQGSIPKAFEDVITQIDIPAIL